MVFFTASSEEEASLNFIEEVKSKFEGDGKSPLENKLIAIDTEFWLKSNEIEGELINKKMDTSTYISKDFILQLEKLSKKSKPGVVTVLTDKATGSGFVVRHIKNQTLILTNSHVIQGANKINVEWSDGKTETFSSLWYSKEKVIKLVEDKLNGTV